MTLSEKLRLLADRIDSTDAFETNNGSSELALAFWEVWDSVPRKWKKVVRDTRGNRLNSALGRIRKAEDLKHEAKQIVWGWGENPDQFLTLVSQSENNVGDAPLDRIVYITRAMDVKVTVDSIRWRILMIIFFHILKNFEHEEAGIGEILLGLKLVSPCYRETCDQNFKTWKAAGSKYCQLASSLSTAGYGTVIYLPGLGRSFWEKSYIPRSDESVITHYLLKGVSALSLEPWNSRTSHDVVHSIVQNVVNKVTSTAGSVIINWSPRAKSLRKGQTRPRAIRASAAEKRKQAGQVRNQRPCFRSDDLLTLTLLTGRAQTLNEIQASNGNQNQRSGTSAIAPERQQPDVLPQQEELPANVSSHTRYPTAFQPPVGGNSAQYNQRSAAEGRDGMDQDETAMECGPGNEHASIRGSIDEGHGHATHNSNGRHGQNQERTHGTATNSAASGNQSETANGRNLDQSCDSPLQGGDTLRGSVNERPTLIFPGNMPRLPAIASFAAFAIPRGDNQQNAGFTAGESSSNWGMSTRSLPAPTPGALTTVWSPTNHGHFGVQEQLSLFSGPTQYNTTTANPHTTLNETSIISPPAAPSYNATSAHMHRHSGGEFCGVLTQTGPGASTPSWPTGNPTWNVMQTNVPLIGMEYIQLQQDSVEATRAPKYPNSRKRPRLFARNTGNNAAQSFSSDEPPTHGDERAGHHAENISTMEQANSTIGDVDILSYFNDFDVDFDSLQDLHNQPNFDCNIDFDQLQDLQNQLGLNYDINFNNLQDLQNPIDLDATT
ncbi:hypothetical protein LOZ58_006826 [Ophidiomyces ophidiicola]|nr:hypothetical protein LOZ65_006772 [Ophidiomyces ophidiicola]KAI1955171.1 hypothetical protein LOZ58_006826 [Ophidiomyces ophidiicola]